MVKPLKDKKDETVLNVNFNSKPNKLWVGKGREFYNKLTQELFDNNDILMYLAHNEGKSIIAERFIKPLKAKIYKKNDS